MKIVRSQQRPGSSTTGFVYADGRQVNWVPGHNGKNGKRHPGYPSDQTCDLCAQEQ